LFHTNGQTDGQTDRQKDMTKLTVAFRSFENTPNKEPVRTAQKTHPVSVIKTSQLMLYWEIIAVCSQIHTKYINTLCGQNVELYMKAQSVPRSKHIPSRLYKLVS